MAWEENYKTDGGLLPSLNENSFADLPSSAIHYTDAGTAGEVNTGEVYGGNDYFSGQNLVACPMDVITETGWHNLAFFKLYNKSDKSFSGNYLVFRINTTNYRAGEGHWMGNGGWFLYDGQSDTFTAFSTTNSNLFGLWSSSGYNNETKIFFHTDTVSVGSASYTRLYMGTHCKVAFDPFMCNTYGRIISLNFSALTSYNVDLPLDVTSPEFGKASEPAGGYNEGGGHGSFDDSSDTIGLDAKPQVGVTSAGFINVYKIGVGELSQLGEKLFPHFLPAEILKDPTQINVGEAVAMLLKSFYGSIVSPVGTAVELSDNLGIIDILMNGKLIDYVLDCHIIPTSISSATVEGLKIGYRQFNDLQLAKASEDYVDVDCGSLSIPEYWANFLDFSGNCSLDLYLPFVGYVPIDNEYWNGGTIQVIYRFNIVDGSFQAKVFATSGKSNLTASLIAQHGGVACVHFPITGLQYSNVVAGLVNGTTGAVAKGASGDVGGAVANAFNMAMLRPDAPASNGYNASSSFLSHRTPYLVIKRPTAQFSQNYPHEMGLPLNVTRLLSTVHGFTVIDNPVLNIACSDSEYQELVSLLKNGVIF